MYTCIYFYTFFVFLVNIICILLYLGMCALFVKPGFAHKLSLLRVPLWVPNYLYVFVFDCTSSETRHSQESHSLFGVHKLVKKLIMIMILVVI